MIRWETAWRRAKEANHPFVVKRNITDFRSLHYNQIFSAVAQGTTSATTLQTFPSGAFVLGISASANVPILVKRDQYYADGAAVPLDVTIDRLKSSTPGNRDLFGIDFAYTNDEQLTPGGPAIADALLGSGSGTEYPARELIIDPSQGILCRVQNLITAQTIDNLSGSLPTGISFPITVHVVYKCMVPRSQG
jgi:hypothetical protein